VGCGICQRGGGEGGRKSLKVLKVEAKALFLACFGHISIIIMLKMNRKGSKQRKIEKK